MVRERWQKHIIIDCEGESSKRREIIDDGEGVDKIKELFEKKNIFFNTLYLRLIRIIKLWTMLCFHTLIILSRHGNENEKFNKSSDKLEHGSGTSRPFRKS